ncbi:MAG TPA: ABC transporter ATP-binding protein [Verrucomicrobia bacterium]|nr:MAG: dipeptide/oligopeptide/nickel ABC transporter ATP-binding protein [Lentisphaerae bacterium GWF2_57_35]HBA86162.1 ABC transporter ATP-binding protein [Verrucomicrobiota bacterium]
MPERDLLLDVRGLKIEFGTGAQGLRVVDDLSFNVRDGETVALVGESGCGKSVTALALAKLIPQPPGRFAGGEVLFGGQNVLSMGEKELRRLRGADISYVFQEPGQSLNPVFRIGWQLREALQIHRPDQATTEEMVRLLKQVGLPDPEQKLRAYPHELSGGMQQRVMIAMALACRPRLLVADEPTTALDVTIQLQILELLKDLQRQLGMAVILITHNLGLVADCAHRVNVMYAGRIVEAGPTEEVLGHPRHPYTRGLLEAVPKLEGSAGHLKGIDGHVPNPARMPSGCKFHPRCPLCAEICREREPADETVREDHIVRCHFWQKGGDS